MKSYSAAEVARICPVRGWLTGKIRIPGIPDINAMMASAWARFSDRCRGRSMAPAHAEIQPAWVRPRPRGRHDGTGPQRPQNQRAAARGTHIVAWRPRSRAVPQHRGEHAVGTAAREIEDLSGTQVCSVVRVPSSKGRRTPITRRIPPMHKFLATRNRASMLTMYGVHQHQEGLGGSPCCPPPSPLRQERTVVRFPERGKESGLLERFCTFSDRQLRVDQATMRIVSGTIRSCGCLHSRRNREGLAPRMRSTPLGWSAVSPAAATRPRVFYRAWGVTPRSDSESHQPKWDCDRREMVVIRYTVGPRCGVRRVRRRVSARLSVAIEPFQVAHSPTRMMSGSWRRAARNACLKERVCRPTWRWVTRHFLLGCTNSIGSSMVMM